MPIEWDELQKIKEYEKKCPDFGCLFACWISRDCDIKEECKKRTYQLLSRTISRGAQQPRAKRRVLSREEFQKLSKEKPEHGRTKRKKKKSKKAKGDTKTR